MSGYGQYLSGNEKRKRKQLEEQNKNLPKIFRYFKNEDFIESNEQQGGNEETDLTTSDSIAVPHNSEYLDPV